MSVILKNMITSFKSVFVLKKHPWVFALLLGLLLVFPTLTTFFSGDDFFHLKISQANNLQEVGSFFSFYKPSGEFLFYRPLTTQLPNFIFFKLFGLNSTPYHLLGWLLFSLIIYLVYQLAKEISGNKKAALWTSFFYGLSASNFTRLAWIAQIQELGFGVNFLAACLFFLRNRLGLSLLFFLLALGSKESAVVLPLVLLVLIFFPKKIFNKKYFAFFILNFAFLLVYLYFRVFKMGFSAEAHYFTDFSFKTALNTAFWYGLWALSLPELLVDYVSSGLQINPRLWLLHGQYMKPILAFFGLFGLTVLLAVIRGWSRINKRLVGLAGFWFVINLLPHLFSPFHKFSYELTVPLFGIALALALIFAQSKPPRLAPLALGLFFGLSALTNCLTFKTHWSFQRGQIVRRVLDYMARYYPQSPEQPLFFYNDLPTENAIWGVSRQIDQGLFGSYALRLFYQKPELVVYFEDDSPPPAGEPVIKLPASAFF